MEPRLRGIEHIEFWKIDEQRRRVGVREAPVYPLERARRVIAEPGDDIATETVLDALETQIGASESTDSVTEG